MVKEAMLRNTWSLCQITFRTPGNNKSWITSWKLVETQVNFFLKVKRFRYIYFYFLKPF